MSHTNYKENFENKINQGNQMTYQIVTIKYLHFSSLAAAGVCNNRISVRLWIAEGENTVRVGRRVSDGVQHFHVDQVVHENTLLQTYHQDLNTNNQNISNLTRSTLSVIIIAAFRFLTSRLSFTDSIVLQQLQEQISEPRFEWNTRSRRGARQSTIATKALLYKRSTKLSCSVLSSKFEKDIIGHFFDIIGTENLHAFSKSAGKEKGNRTCYQSSSQTVKMMAVIFSLQGNFYVNQEGILLLNRSC